MLCCCLRVAITSAKRADTAPLMKAVHKMTDPEYLPVFLIHLEHPYFQRDDDPDTDDQQQIGDEDAQDGRQSERPRQPY